MITKKNAQWFWFASINWDSFFTSSSIPSWVNLSSDHLSASIDPHHISLANNFRFRVFLWCLLVIITRCSTTTTTYTHLAKSVSQRLLVLRGHIDIRRRKSLEHTGWRERLRKSNYIDLRVQLRGRKERIHHQICIFQRARKAELIHATSVSSISRPRTLPHCSSLFAPQSNL